MTIGKLRLLAAGASVGEGAIEAEVVWAPSTSVVVCSGVGEGVMAGALEVYWVS